MNVRNIKVPYSVIAPSWEVAFTGVGPPFFEVAITGDPSRSVEFRRLRKERVTVK